jgi:casein kinase II subunit beta
MVEVDLDFIRDPFNLQGLQVQVPQMGKEKLR